MDQKKYGAFPTGAFLPKQISFVEIGDVRAEIALAKHVLHERPQLRSQN